MTRKRLLPRTGVRTVRGLGSENDQRPREAIAPEVSRTSRIRTAGAAGPAKLPSSPRRRSRPARVARAARGRIAQRVHVDARRASIDVRRRDRGRRAFVHEAALRRATSRRRACARTPCPCRPSPSRRARARRRCRSRCTAPGSRRSARAGADRRSSGGPNTSRRAQRACRRAIAFGDVGGGVGEAEPAASSTRGRISTIGGPCQCSSGNCWSACIIIVAARM